MMASVDLSHILLTVAALAALFTAGMIWWWRRRHRLSPAEREQARRLAVNASGRLTDGSLVESPYAPSTAAPGLIFYRYTAFGVEYTAAQDISSLAPQTAFASLRPGAITAVKYDPRKPSNSIVVCERWSGLREDRAGPSQPHGGAERNIGAA